MRLIDANAFIHEINGYFRPIDESQPMTLTVGQIEEVLDIMQTIEAVPVVRGNWVHGCRNGMGTEYCYCSECSEDALKDASGFVEFSNICPHCGARMDGDSE